MRNKNKAEVIAFYTIGYLVLLIFCFLIYGIFTCLSDIGLFGKLVDHSAIFTSLLGWSATLYAPIIAIFLFTDWKEQHNIQLQKELTLDILKKINAFKLELPKLEHHYLNLEFQLEHPENINIREDNIDLFIEQFNTILEMKNELYLHLLDYLTPLKDDKELLKLYPKYKEIIKPIDESQKILWELKIINNGVDTTIYKEKMYTIHSNCLQVAKQLSIEIIPYLTTKLKA